MGQTECTITVDPTKKTVSIQGTVAARELVKVILVNAGTVTPADIILALSKGVTTLVACADFSAEGDTYVGNLDLSDDDILALFDDNASAKALVTVTMSLWNTSTQNLMFASSISIQNNVFDPEMEGATPV